MFINIVRPLPDFLVLRTSCSSPPLRASPCRGGGCFNCKHALGTVYNWSQHDDFVRRLGLARHKRLEQLVQGEPQHAECRTSPVVGLRLRLTRPTSCRYANLHPFPTFSSFERAVSVPRFAGACVSRLLFFLLLHHWRLWFFCWFCDGRRKQLCCPCVTAVLREFAAEV